MLHKAGTWELVELLPKVNIVRLKWVFRMLKGILCARKPGLSCKASHKSLELITLTPMHQLHTLHLFG